MAHPVELLLSINTSCCDGMDQIRGIARKSFRGSVSLTTQWPYSITPRMRMPTKRSGLC